MERKKIRSATDQRPFIMVYQDFLESDLLDNYYQKLVYIYLKKFANSKNQCFPSIKTLSRLTKISANKVKSTLAELEEKGVIAKENCTRPDGGKSSNLYTLYDFRKLWNAGSDAEAAAVVNEYEEEKLIDLLRAKGYIVKKEKEPTSAPTKASDVSTKFDQLDVTNTTANSTESQEVERYSLEEIRQLFDYSIMVNDYPYRQQDIDSVMDILYSAMNTTKATIRIAGEDRPSMSVIGKLMKLHKESIMYAIGKFSEQTERIKNPASYMLTILYNTPEQFNLDIQNQVSHDMAHRNGSGGQ